MATSHLSSDLELKLNQSSPSRVCKMKAFGALFTCNQLVICPAPAEHLLTLHGFFFLHMHSFADQPPHLFVAEHPVVETPASTAAAVNCDLAARAPWSHLSSCTDRLTPGSAYLRKRGGERFLHVVAVVRGDELGESKCASKRRLSQSDGVSCSPLTVQCLRASQGDEE